MRYSGSIDINQCYTEKASTILKEGVGDCVSMSRLATALLRAQGIPTRTMGGCLSFLARCSPTMAAVPFIQTQVTEMQPNDFKKRGFLHEWIETWIPEKGWVLGEATAGQVFDLTCKSYIQYGYDSNSMERCVINDQSFWNICKEV